MLQPSDIEDAAMFLLHLRTQRSQVSGLPGELAPKNADEAYAIQDAGHRFAGWPIGMHKVGATSEAARQFLGVEFPIAGQIPVEGLFETGATVPQAFLAGTPLLECEIALRVGADSKADAVAPAIELVNGRYLDPSKVSGFGLIADNSAGCAVVLGDPIAIEDVGDLSALGARLTSGDNELATGNTQALDGGPQASLDWWLEHEASRGRAIVPGTWLITGTCTGLTPTEFGATYTAEFDALGTVTFTLE